MNIKVVLCLCLVSMLLCAGVSALSETGYLNSTVYGQELIGGYGGATAANTWNYNGISFKNIQNYEEVTTIIFYSSDAPYILGDGPFVLSEGGTVLGTGYYMSFDNGPSYTVQFQFDTWDIAGRSGNKIATLQDGLKIYSTLSNVEGAYSKNIGLVGGTAGGIRCMRQSSAIITFHTDYVNKYTFDDLDTYGRLEVDRDCNPVTPSTVNIYDGYVNLTLSEYAVSGTSQCFVYTNPVLLSITYGGSGGSKTKTFEISNSLNPPYITPTPTVTPTPTSGCGMNIELSLSKTSSIAPLTEYINASISLSGNYELIAGSTIGYYIGAGSGGTINPVAVATFTNTTGGWYYNKNNLGVTSNGFTTYDDILSELIRFPDSGNYIVRAAVMPYGSCSKYDEKYVYVNPSSQVNLDIYFKDGITYNMIPSVTSAISIVNVTGNTTYSGNPIGIATQIGQNVSIYATAEGYTPKHIYYTIPSSVYGNTLDIPFFMFPTDYGEYYPDNTTWTISVKSITSGENIYGASVRASDYSGTIDEGYTNSDGYVTLFVPFRDSPVRLDVARVPYISSSQWVNLGNATEYATTVYLNYGGTPTPTPSYNYTYTVTPTQTDTPIPTVTQITNPMLTVWVRDAITNLPIGDAYVYIYDGDEIDQNYKGSLIYSSTTDSVQGATPKLQMIANNAYWVVVSKSGYYTLEKRFRMSSQDASIFAPLQPSHGVTIATTQPTLVLPTPGGTGIQGGFIGWILDYFSEWFGVDTGTARILLALFIIMCSSVFVGGSLAGFGSGAGAGMGALIGGMFAFIAMCYVQFLPFWLLPIGIAFVGMAFFVWNRQEN